MKLKTFLIFLLFTTSTCAVALEYTIEPLGTLGGAASYANGINELGQVVGSSNTMIEDSVGEIGHAFLSTETSHGRIMIDLGSLEEGGHSSASTINDTGQIVGTSLAPYGPHGSRVGRSRAFLSEDTGDGRFMIDLGTMGASSSANDINNAGQIVGTSRALSGTGSYKNHAFISEETENGRVMTDLGTLGADNSSAYAINDLGQVVGFGKASLNHFHAFISDPGKGNRVMTFLYPNENRSISSMARHLNNLGQALVGGGFASRRAGLLSSETEGGRVLSTLKGFPLVAGGSSHDHITTGMNDAGEIVGHFIVNPSTDIRLMRFVGYLYKNNEYFPLTDLITDSTGWSGLKPAEINNRGQIVGTGVYERRPMAFLLTPVNPDFAPPVCEMGSDPQTIRAGEGVPLWWWTQDVINYPIIMPGVGQVRKLEGSKWVYPTATTTYKMSAKGRDKVATCETTIEVEGEIDPVPPQCGIGADPQTIRAGDNVPLWWWFQDSVVTANIDNSIGSISDVQGNKWIHPAETTTYTMTIEDRAGIKNTCETTVVVEGVTAPALPVCSIGTHHKVIRPNEKTTVWWWTADETETINISPGLGQVDVTEGTRTVEVSETTTFRMDVVARGRSGFCETTVVLEDQ
ncbi:MAG: hypothetical protein V3U75_06515 [Methylococcaceae bacterium]